MPLTLRRLYRLKVYANKMLADAWMKDAIELQSLPLNFSCTFKEGLSLYTIKQLLSQEDSLLILLSLWTVQDCSILAVSRATIGDESSALFSVRGCPTIQAGNVFIVASMLCLVIKKLVEIFRSLLY